MSRHVIEGTFLEPNFVKPKTTFQFFSKHLTTRNFKNKMMQLTCLKTLHRPMSSQALTQK